MQRFEIVGFGRLKRCRPEPGFEFGDSWFSDAQISLCAGSPDPPTVLFESRLAHDRVEQGEIIASRELKQPLDAGDLTVMTAYYSLNSGEVEFT